MNAHECRAYYRLKPKIRLDSVTCVMDAEQVFAHPECPPLMELKLIPLRLCAFAREIILCRLFPFLRFSVPHFSVFSPFAPIRLNFPVGAVPK